MGYKGAVRCCSNCITTYRLTRSGTTPSRIIAFVNMFFSDQLSEKLIKRKKELMNCLVCLNQDLSLVEAIAIRKIPSLNSWSMMIHLDGVSLSEDSKGVRKTVDQANNVLTEKPVHSETSKRSSTMFDKSSSFRIKDVHSMTVEELHEELFTLRLYGAAFVVKEQSRFHSRIFYRRLLVITPDGEIALSGGIEESHLQTKEFSGAHALLLRTVKSVATLSFVGFGDLPTTVKSSTEEPVSLKDKPEKKKLSLSFKDKIRPENFVKKVIEAQGTVEALIVLTQKCLRLEWTDGTVLNLLVLDNAFQIDQFSLNECIQVIKAHRQRFQMMEEQLISSLERKAEKTQIMVSWDIPKHEEMLKRLWEQLKDTEFPGRKSEEWKSLGFQGQNPQTDFRGMGELALEALVYWSRKFPRSAKELVRLQSERTYPLCTAAINCVSMIFDMIQYDPLKELDRETIRTKPLFQLLCRCRDDLDAFFELLVLMLKIMDKLSVEMDAGYMDIPLVFKAMITQINEYLEWNPFDIAVMAKWASQK